jgi:hypothetical protein
MRLKLRFLRPREDESRREPRQSVQLSHVTSVEFNVHAIVNRKTKLQLETTLRYGASVGPGTRDARAGPRSGLPRPVRSGLRLRAPR